MKTLILFLLSAYFLVFRCEAQEKVQISGAIILDNSEDETPTPGTIRWNETDFEGWDGENWMSFTDQSTWQIQDTNIYNLNSGNVGIGNGSPAGILDINSSKDYPVLVLGSKSNISNSSIALMTNRLDSSKVLGQSSIGTGNTGWRFTAAHSNTTNPNNANRLFISFWNGSINRTPISLSPTGEVFLNGNVSVDGRLTVFGSDLAEKFYVETNSNVAPLPGMAVSISENNPFHLEISNKQYDRSVVGIISGANNLNAGLQMSQAGTFASGDIPVALMGRVYAFADASYGKINIGDDLCTARKTGYLMKAKKWRRSGDCIIGKALESLEQGSSLILILIK